MCVLVNLHLETGVAYSRNSPPSPRGRPSALLLDRALSELARGHNVMYKSIAVSPLTSTASLFSIYQLPLCLRSSLASVCFHTSAALGHPHLNFLPLLIGFLRSCGLKIPSPNTPIQSWVSSFLLIWKSNPSSG